jgi:hypothetical protein
MVTKEATCVANGVRERKCSCGEIQTFSIPATNEHQYGEWTTSQAPTCTSTGEQMRSCDCGDKQTVSIEPLGHDFDDGVVAKEATCTEAGTLKYTCATCNTEKTETIAKKGHTEKTVIVQEATCGSDGKEEVVCSVCNALISANTLPATNNHSYNNGIVTKEATCLVSGEKKITCSTCGDSKTEAIPALGHTVNSNSICTRCGETALSMTTKEMEDSKKVANMRYSATEYSDHISISMVLTDSNGTTLQVPAYVLIKITDEKGTVVYEEKIIKKSSQDRVDIKYDSITPGYTNNGTLEYTVYSDYFHFNTLRKDVTKLPWTVDIVLPELPDNIWYNGYSSSHGCKVTNIRFVVQGDDLYIYFTGEKVYDSKGNNYSQACKIGWKLYDSDGYVVKDGTCYTTSLKTGEKFKDAKAYAFDCIEQGKTYRLEILDVA